MAGQELLVHTHLRLTQNSALSFDATSDFPLSPNPGQFALVQGILYIYAALGGVNTWFPLTNKKNSHVHYQVLPATQWTVTHNYSTTDLIYFAYDENGSMLVVNADFIDDDHFQLNFGTAAKGKVVVFAHSDLWVPRMETTEGYAEVLTLGQYLKVAGDTVLLNEAGVTVNGVNLVDWIKANEDRLNVHDTMLADKGDYGEIGKSLRPASDKPVELGDVNKRFDAVHSKQVTTEDVSIDDHNVDAVTDPSNTADSAAGRVAGNVVEAHARNADGGLQKAAVKLVGTDGHIFTLQYNQSTSTLEFVDESGAAIDVSAKSLVGAELTITGAATIEDLNVQGDAVIGSDASDTATVNATTVFKAPVKFEGEGTLGNGDDNLAINCGPEHLLTVISKYFSLAADGTLSVKNLSVSENMNVVGTVTQNDSVTVDTGEQFLNLLKDVTGAPSLDGGVNVVRGTSATASIRWDETQKKWLAGVDGDLHEVVRGDDGRLLSADQATELTSAGQSALHYHAADRDRANHTGQQGAETIHDFDAAVAAAPAVADLQTGKVDAEDGKGLSENDLTAARLAKLEAALTSVSWDDLTTKPDLTGAGPHPADEFTLLEVANLRSGKSAMGETLARTLVFGGDDEPAAEAAGTGDIWFDTSGEATIVKKKNGKTGEFDFIAQIASEMIMRHSNVVYVDGPLDTTHSFTHDVEGLPQTVTIKPNFVTVYLNRQLLRKSEYNIVDATTIEVLVDLASGDELELVTA